MLHFPVCLSVLAEKMEGTSQDLLPESSNDTFVSEYSQVSLWGIVNKAKSTNNDILTFIRNLDVAIGMGIPLGFLTEICGMPFSGRTKLCVKLCISVTIPESLFGHDGESLYMNCRKKFQYSLITELVGATNDYMKERFERQNFTLTADEVCNRIHYVYIDGEKKFQECLDSMKDYLQEHPKIRLVVVDSLVAIFYGNTEHSLQRVVTLHRVITQLADVAFECNVAIVIVNDMTTKIYNNGQSSKIIPALGAYFAYKISRIIQLSPTIDGKYSALLKRGYKKTGQIINFDFQK